MTHPKLHIQFITTLLLITSQSTSSASTKPNARPVYEVINEQTRIDDKPKVTNNPGILPYGNPLAGNSKQNARLHASNQQAMFNAERIRQHKAQLQRWTKGPQIIDSYMKAYHDLQENHQLEIEEQQATLKDSPVTPAVTNRGRPIRQRVQNKRVQSNSDNSDEALSNEPSFSSNRVQSQRREIPRRSSSIQRSEPMKITKADAVIKTRNRNHRSYGSADYHQYVEPKRYKTIYVSPVPYYSQDVTIKPNGNIGLNQLQTKEPSKLYTEAIPSEATPTYPKRYGVHKFNSVQEIEALNYLLSKNPTEQLSKFTALLNSQKGPEDTVEREPIDYYFYLNDSPQNVPQDFDPVKYASAYKPDIPIKDHIPITEETDDIQDPTQNKRPITFSQPIAPTTASKLETDSKNYYKVEDASQVICDDSKTSPVNYINDDKDAYHTVNYGYLPYINKETEADTSEIYLHHNAQPTVVQHLSEDGTETSAYGDDNLKYAANYEFGYRVKDQDSGNYFGHREAKKGENTKGQYHVLLPDGRMQQVNYSAGPEGFHADITYDHLQ
ncbi:uncharacterized protein LOC124540840 [Vanessa cardui]|uniref:uncharacterized protein LOC124540840 n=1 Tax=Vanessa cardui TaxID=171605 RepID=UPI001F12AF7B|nr:uncharacterized protein LOC124540840 [Vanessa cardui]